MINVEAHAAHIQTRLANPINMTQGSINHYLRTVAAVANNKSEDQSIVVIAFLAGVENGKDCYCAADSAEYERLGELGRSSCETPCEGDETTTCGGPEAIEVFRIKNEVIDYSVNAQLPK